MNKKLIPKIKDNNKYYFSDLNEWYNHYKSELKLLYNNFIWICQSKNIKIHSNNETFNYFIRYVYFNSYKIKLS